MAVVTGKVFKFGWILLRHWPDAYCFLLLAGPPLAPWRLALLFVYDTPFYTLLLFIPQCSYLAYLCYGTVTVYSISNYTLSRSLFFPAYYLRFLSVINNTILESQYSLSIVLDNFNNFNITISFIIFNCRI